MRSGPGTVKKTIHKTPTSGDITEHVGECAQFFVVVPAYNEESYILDCLLGLANQSDTEFEILIVDNASSDSTCRRVAEFAAAHQNLSIHLDIESEKGTGSAIDTGFHNAIERGAVFIARTDADSVPHADWVKTLKKALVGDQLEFVAGRVEPRTDDINLSRKDRVLLPFFRFLVENYGKLHRRGRQFKYPYFLVVGANLAITSDLYLRSGGFPRVSLEEHSNDIVLGEAVRTLTERGELRRDAIVYSSIRRLRQYGYIRTLLWLWNRRYRAAKPDVRL
jgi:glycosyltransferase involved in cell wall biosynthesis